MVRFTARLIATVCMLYAIDAVAATGWVSDVFYVPLRSGPSDSNRIIHRGLPSGTVLEILEDDTERGFSHVRTPAGVDGWMNSQYVIREPIAAVRLEVANKRIKALEAQAAQRGETLSELRESTSEASSENDALSTQVAQLDGELSELKRVSASAIEIQKQNESLTSLNERLRGEVDRLIDEVQRLESNIEQRWMLIGAGLALGGLLAGVALKVRPRRSGWS